MQTRILFSEFKYASRGFWFRQIRSYFGKSEFNSHVCLSLSLYILFFSNQVHYQPSVTYSVCLCTGWSKHYYRSSKSKFPTLGNVHHDCLRERIGSYWIIPKSQKFVDFFRYVSGPQSFTYPLTSLLKNLEFQCSHRRIPMELRCCTKLFYKKLNIFRLQWTF